ncbi:MAG TPA: M15 family metallopeptidase [Capillimicrobium sp.]
MISAAALAATVALVNVGDAAPRIEVEMRYAGPHNFVGERITGYREPLCLLTRPAARALGRAQRIVWRQGYTLKVYDCYRPQRAVDHFVRWARDLGDERMKAEFYPRVDKARLFSDGYIAERSGHSRGSTVDLTLVRRPPADQEAYRRGDRLRSCFAPRARRFGDNSVDMGTGYDCFDTLSHTLDRRVTGRQRANRLTLKRAMSRAGFENYANEWWHYTLRDEPFTHRYFDVPVRRSSIAR